MKLRRTRWVIPAAVVLLGVAAFIALRSRLMPENIVAYDRFLDSATEQRLLFAHLAARIDRYRMVHGAWPTDLESAVTDSALGPPDRHLRVDVWGDTLAYRVVGSRYELRSAGPDRVLGSADDMVHP